MNGSIKLRSKTIGGVRSIELKHQWFTCVTMLGEEPYFQRVDAIGKRQTSCISMTQGLKECSDSARVRHFNWAILKAT